ncbi:hypothetical protein FRB94_006672 [Tulasnella sp. JGI-2019a]|nr:hypothetical protein FRB94_006672 [Tulasnella sp. JGI-2019a]
MGVNTSPVTTSLTPPVIADSPTFIAGTGGGAADSANGGGAEARAGIGGGAADVECGGGSTGP